MAKSQYLMCWAAMEKFPAKGRKPFAYGINVKVTERCALQSRPTDHPQAFAHQQNEELVMLLLSFAPS